MSSYGNVRGGKLVLKGGLNLEKTIDKKKKKRKTKKNMAGPEAEAEDQPQDQSEVDKEAVTAKPDPEIDTGTGFAPDGKKSKKYEELFPVETKRFGFKEPDKVQTREQALEERVKRKADRYCK